MKYKNRLIVPTFVTLSLFAVSANANGEEINNANESENIEQENTYTSDSTVDKVLKNEETSKNETPVTSDNEESDNSNGNTFSKNSSVQAEEEDISQDNINTEKTSSSESQYNHSDTNTNPNNAQNITDNENLSSDNIQKKPENEEENRPTLASDNPEKVNENMDNVSGEDGTELINESGTKEKNFDDSNNKKESEKFSSSDDELLNESNYENATTETSKDNHEKKQNFSNDKEVPENVESSEDGLLITPKNNSVTSESSEETHEEIRETTNNDQESQENTEASKEDLLDSTKNEDKIPEGTKDREDISNDDEKEVKSSTDKTSNKNENTQIKDSKENQLDKNELIESDSKIHGLKTFILPSSATLKAETLKTSVDAAPNYDDAYYAARVSSGPNSGRYSPVTSDDSKSLGWLENRTLFISQQAEYNGTTFYKIHSGIDGPMQGWVKKEDLRLFDMTKPANHKKTYDIKLDKHHLLTDPWGTENQYMKRLDRYGDTPFHAEKTLELGAHTYYYGKIGKDRGWLEESRLVDTSRTPYYRDMEVAARVKSGGNSGRYSPVTSKNSVSLGWLENRTLFITEQAKYQGTTFYKIHSGIDGPMQGWVKSEDLRLFDTTNPVAHKKDYAIYQPGHHLLSDPWGTANQYIKQLSEYGDALFRAEKSMKLGAHTYYYGKIGNDYGWLEQSRVKPAPSKPVAPSPTVKTVQHSQSLTQAINTQMNLSSKPQAWADGGGWRNATRSEVARFLDTSHQTSETWMYTFLDLDRSQNIASSTINNKLLNGKGTLHNQGSAFTNAANTQGINEVYLISHAIHETGNGQSTLAQGVRLDSNGNISSNGKKYYNMYGIGAYDYNPVLAGARYAQQMGWDTPAKAIVGGARFISQSYFNRGQTTLYSMRWNPLNPGAYQYATDVNWAYATARNLQNYYNQLEIKGRYYTKHIF